MCACLRVDDHSNGICNGFLQFNTVANWESGSVAKWCIDLEKEKWYVQLNNRTYRMAFRMIQLIEILVRKDLSQFCIFGDDRFFIIEKRPG